MNYMLTKLKSTITHRDISINSALAFIFFHHWYGFLLLLLDNLVMKKIARSIMTFSSANSDSDLINEFEWLRNALCGFTTFLTWIFAGLFKCLPVQNRSPVADGKWAMVQEKNLSIIIKLIIIKILKLNSTC